MVVVVGGDTLPAAGRTPSGSPGASQTSHNLTYFLGAGRSCCGARLSCSRQMPRCRGLHAAKLRPMGTSMSPIPVHTWWHYRPAWTLPEGPSLLPFVRCRCPEQVLGSRREVTAQARSCQTGLCVAAIKSGVFVYPARGAENQGSFLGVTWPASPRQGWEPWGHTHTHLCLAPATLAVSPPPGLPTKSCKGRHPPPQCWGAGAEAEGILASFLPQPPAQEAALSCLHPAPSRHPPTASGHRVPCTHTAAGLWLPRPCPVLGWEHLQTEQCCGGGLGAHPAWCGSPCRAGRLPVRQERSPSPAHPGEAESMTPGTGHPQGHFGEVSRGCPDPEVPAGGLSAAKPGLAPGPGRCCRLPNSPAWLGGRCLFRWQPGPQAGGGAGCGREALHHGGGSGGSPCPSACCVPAPCLLGSWVPWGAAPNLVGLSQHQETRLVLGTSWGRGDVWGNLKSCCLALLTLSLLRQCWYQAFL